jgi:CTP:molybdopterin cytidylyltransferase MocA
MSPDRLSAIVLAAGYSSRMGKFKPLLPIGGKTVIELTISIFKENEIHDIMVVTGYRGSQIRRALQDSGVTLIKNTEYDLGMFSSVKTGVNALDTDKTKAFFIMPADSCLVRPPTVRLLAAAHEKTPGNIIHPRFGSRRGHPPLIPVSLAPVILKSDTDSSLNAILKKFEHLAVDLQVPDEHILFDMNRSEDYATALLTKPNI